MTILFGLVLVDQLLESNANLFSLVMIGMVATRVRSGSWIQTVFIVIGLCCGMALTAADFYTSLIGLQSILPQDGSALMRWLPPVLAGLALAMNAQASRMVRMFQQNDEGSVGIGFLMFAFFVTLAFDGGSSWVGFIQQITKKSDFTEAINAATMTQLVAASVIAILSTIGPFLCSVFSQLLKEQGGLFSGLLGDDK